jgi:type I restriction enzyme S subunit
VEWIGEIPEHWNLNRLKWVSKLEYGDSLAVVDRESGGDIPVYGSNGIAGFHNRAITKSPCLVIGRKGSYGKVNWSDGACFPIDTTYYIDKNKTVNNLRWLFYLLPKLGLDLFSRDTGVPGLNREDAYQKELPIPPIDEQTAIANYLDEKTAKIDSLVEKKKKMIEH